MLIIVGYDVKYIMCYVTSTTIFEFLISVAFVTKIARFFNFFTLVLLKSCMNLNILGL